ncbi:MAG: TfoX/Sxy family protein [Deltaproteobacteria bacterium]|nr:TfoX/Sxy family protein [Deltaproteobacteria bacterium]
MAYNQQLTERIRDLLKEKPGLSEKKMFGGIGFLTMGNMACGVLNNDLIVRVGPENYNDSLKLPNTRPFDITGRPMKGWVMVSSKGYQTNKDLDAWVERGVTFSLTLPAK